MEDELAGVRRLYTGAATGELDRRAVEAGIPGIVLMRRAGAAAFGDLRARWPDLRSITVCCGRGNNAGDGYVIAGMAVGRGMDVQLLHVTDPDELGGDAARARDWAVDEGVRIERFDPGAELRGDVVVDALLGTGIKGEVRPEFAAAVAWINDAGRPVMAVDVPTGLSADTGAVLGCVVRADLTPTFIGVKRGLLTGAGPAWAGEIRYHDLGVPASVFDGEGAPDSVALLRLGEEHLTLARRPRNAHKGRYGHVLVVGGDLGMGGAVSMAAEAALRVGSGLVSAATRPAHVAALLARRPEVMVAGVDARADLEPLLERADVVVVGTGLGRAPWGEQLLDAVLASGLPLVVDADGLNLLATMEAPPRRDDWILTPHPGEAARLLDITPAEIEADRFAAVAALQARFGGAVLLKGAGTLLADSQGVSLCPYGNPGMASGGMGDVLSGVLGGLAAQGRAPGEAAALGICLHGAAADAAAARLGEPALLASDLLDEVGGVIRGIER